MALSSKQPRWDIYETVILLEGYLETLQGIQSKSQIIKRISADLRRMAVNRGVEIDDVYRNENGISYQIQSMDSAFKGQKVYVPATKLFTDAVTLYRTDNDGYQKFLWEAKGMIAVKQNNREAFLIWAKSAFSAQRCKWLEENILKMERFAVAARMISGSIFDVTDTAKLEAVYRASCKNKFFQIRHRKFIKNINEDFKEYIKYCSLKPDIREPASDSKAPTMCEESYDSLKITYEKRLYTAAIDKPAADMPLTSTSETTFYSYLQDVAKLAERSCVAYVSNIRSAERYAAERNYTSCSLFSEDMKTLAKSRKVNTALIPFWNGHQRKYGCISF